MFAIDDSMLDDQLKVFPTKVSRTFCDLSRASGPSKHEAGLLPRANQCGLRPRVACVFPVEVRVLHKFY